MAKVPFSKINIGDVILTGGLNEAVTSLELTPGELLVCKNYHEVDGEYHGQRSEAGYERFDGNTSPSSVALVYDSEGTVTSDTAREAARAAIGAIPGNDNPLGITVYGGKAYVFRNHDATTAKMFVESATGWDEVDTSGDPLNDGGDYSFVVHRFATYPSGDPNAEILFWVDGENDLRSFDGTTVSTITHANLPAGVYPTLVGEYKNRLFLVYPNGELFFSVPGDPTDFNTDADAGQIYFGGDITAIKEAPGGSLVVFLRDRIKVINDNNLSDTTFFQFKVNEFGRNTGAIAGSVQEMLGTLIFADDYGVTTLETTESFGSFSASSISKKAHKTYLEKKSLITGSSVDRELNQYRLYFSDNTGLCFTFKEKQLKGIGIFEYDNPVLKVATGEDSSGGFMLLFTSNNNFCYKGKTGESFDGAVIETRMVTSFYHYKSPRYWKRFRYIDFEITAERGTSFSVKPEYDYKDSKWKRSAFQSPELTGFGGVWGQSLWGSFVWGGAYVQRSPLYIEGYGYNMSIELRTAEKYRAQHTVHNFLTDYSVLNRRM